MGLREVSVRNGELQQLSREALGMAVFLRHAHYQVVTLLRELRLSLKFCVTQWVEFDVSVGWVDSFQLTALDYQIKDQEETAADFEDVLWFASGEDHEVLVFVEESTLDVEVFDV